MKKEYFSIPNLLSYFRILMLPVFLYLYFHADTTRDYVVAFALLVISMMTDLVDGWIARKFNMITDFGKLLDPLADKLTQGFLAIAVCSRYPLMISFVIYFACKEFYMLGMGLYIHKKTNHVIAAKMYGKISTVIIDVLVPLMLLFPNMPETLANIFIMIMTVGMTVSLVKYINLHISLLKGKEEGI